MFTKLRATRWYEGEPARPIDIPPTDVHETAGGGGWTSVKHLQSRIPLIRKYRHPIEVVATEFGFRTDEPCAGAFAGLTRVEVVELVTP